MQIKGEEFIRKVQIQQEREELERKLNELEEIDVSAGNNDSVFLGRNNNIDQNEHELDNIMLGSSNYSNEDNKKKYLILGIILVVLFLLTIIIIRLLTDDPSTKEDQFTSNGAASTEVKKLAENENIEENFQKIINERVKKDANEPMVPEIKNTNSGTTTSSTSKTKNNESKNTGTIKDDGNTSAAFESLQKEAENYKPGNNNISDEAMDQTIKKVEKSKSLPKEKVAPVQKQETVKEEVTIKKVEMKKSIKDLVDSAPYSAPTRNSNIATTSTTSHSLADSSSDSSSVSGGYFIQIGAFTKTPTDSYVANIRNAKLKYKIYQDNVSGTIYNKVLIGPYSSKAVASQSVEDVKQKLNVTSAFVVKF